MTVIASAPGKILLLGGYSVLEKPNISYVLAVDAYVQAKVKAIKTDNIIINAPQLKTKLETTIKKIFKLKNEKAKFVISALTTTLQYFKFKRIPHSGFHVTTKSDNAFTINKGKSGLGSSAAVTVATVASLFKEFYPEGDIDQIHNIAQLAHAKAQKKVGSGFDIAAACFGSISYVRYSPAMLPLKDSNIVFAIGLDHEINKISLSKKFKLVFASFKNRSMDTTSAIKKIIKFKKKTKSGYDEIIKEINITNNKAIEALNLNNLKQFKSNFENARLLTKKLGKLAKVEIESNNITKIIEDTKNHGAFVCKLPGAGGRDSILALCLNEKNAKTVKKFWKKKNLFILDVNFVKDGLVVK